MMRTAPAFLALGLLAAAGQGQDDKIGKDKPPAVAKKAVAESQKKKGAAITESAGISLPQRPISARFEGVLLKDFAGVKGSVEVYAKGAATLVRVGDRFEPPENVKGPDQLNALGFKNPALLLAEVSRLAPVATFLSDDPGEGKDCKVLSLVGDEEYVKQHMKEIGARFASIIRSLPNGVDPGNLAGYFDTKTAKSAYRMWVGKADLLVYRIEWTFSAHPKAGTPGVAGVPPFMMAAATDVRFSKWDEEIRFEIPGPVKSKWGIK